MIAFQLIHISIRFGLCANAAHSTAKAGMSQYKLTMKYTTIATGSQTTH